MIRFQCEHCAHKISVQDKHAGKRVKCQKCGSVGTVPVKSTIVDFHCESCGQIISVPQVHAGKKCKCPKCKSIVVVPTLLEAPAKSISTVRFTCSTCNQEIEEPETSRGKLVECPHCRSYVPVPSEKIPAQESATLVQPDKEEGVFEKRPEAPQDPETEIEAEEIEPVDERRLPWLIEIFLYPFSVAGLKSLAILIGVPLLINILGMILPIQLSCLFGLVTMVINIVIFFYIYWYFTECVRDSADGGVRAPEGLGATPGFMGMFWQTVNVIGCLAVFFVPFVFYMLFARRADIIFWLLLIYAVFLSPMGLLAVIMFDSAIGLNPRLLIRSISSTFFPYCGLVLLFVTPVVVIGIIQPEMQESQLWSFIIRSVATYLVLVGAHLFGRFYWRYQEKLNWEV